MELKAVPIQSLDDSGNNLLADVSIGNLMQEVTLELINDIHNKRNKVIAKRLKEIVGIDLDVESEAKRRFKRFAIEYNGNEETVYFNDGSEQGKRVVTFVKKDNPLTFEIDRCQRNLEYTFY
jgi:hypothetical protein